MRGKKRIQQFIIINIIKRVPVLNRVRSFTETRSSGNNFDSPILDIIGLVEKHGYPCLEYNITTKDGYKLKLHRIPESPYDEKKYKNHEKPVVFLQHGILASSDSWTLLGPNKDLAFILADEGWDVWLGNVRGNTYGRSHEELSPKNNEFWKFSFHEMAVYDLPAMIDHALEVSGQKNLFYIGHSMGTTMSYILLSMRPEYNDKIKFSISLAPIAFWNVIPKFPGSDVILKNYKNIKMFLDNNDIHEVLQLTSRSVKLGRSFCSDGVVTQPICAEMLFAISGRNEHFNRTLLPLLLSYFPAGASMQTFYHFVQNMKQRKFQQYDFGFVNNYKLYGQKKPPVYDLTKINTPFALVYSENDPMATKENVMMLAKNLNNVVAVERVASKEFNHLDFLWSLEGKKVLFSKVVNLLENYR
ncbi:lipase 1-like [Aphidius gifuensis]|uniref:lipase 1-like n=1 Tax=Aphidius gifuensis TaxID=684658 RepID=UPI001CDD2C65|nr:lipase 1-like [Aphidius gifuensis]